LASYTTIIRLPRAYVRTQITAKAQVKAVIFGSLVWL
jgi:hypothetical protein